MAPAVESRGHLNPGPDATISRLSGPPDLAHSVVHFWVPEWNLRPGQTSRQMVLSYPVLNLVVQPGAPEGEVTLHGPRTTVAYRVLAGRGWAVGALLRPAAAPVMLEAAGLAAKGARALVDCYVALDQPALVSGVGAAMNAPGTARLEAAVGFVADWIRGLMLAAGAEETEGVLANALLELVDVVPNVGPGGRADELPTSVNEVARRLGTSVRTLERVALAHTGFTPAALLRRRRLLDAADRLRRDPTLDLSRLAQEVGYADHAHLTRDFREVLGFTPSNYRDGGAAKGGCAG